MDGSLSGYSSNPHPVLSKWRPWRADSTNFPGTREVLKIRDHHTLVLHLSSLIYSIIQTHTKRIKGKTCERPLASLAFVCLCWMIKTTFFYFAIRPKRKRKNDRKFILFIYLISALSSFWWRLMHDDDGIEWVNV